MDNQGISVYIYDLDISDKAKGFLVRTGVIRLSDLLSCDPDTLSAIKGITDDVLLELNGVISNADEISRFFEEREKRIAEIYSSVCDNPIEDLGLNSRAYNALRRAGIHTVGSLILLSQKDLFELRYIGQASREEIKKAINNIIHLGKVVSLKDEKKAEAITEDEERKRKINQLSTAMKECPIDNIPFSTRAQNALVRAGIKTVSSLVQLKEKDILGINNVGQQTKDEINSVIKSILNEGKNFFENIMVSDPTPRTGKGFDYNAIDLLLDKFGLKATKIAEWFGLSRQRVYDILEKRPQDRRTVWTGKEFSEKEGRILTTLIEKTSFEYSNDEVTCYCMNNRQDDFVCLFIFLDDIKCFFLKDLPEEFKDKIIEKNMQVFTIRELAGESEGKTVYFLRKPYFRPDNQESFRANAQIRNMTTNDYSIFISGKPMLVRQNVTDEQIMAFLRENLVDGKVSISSAPKNQWIRSLAYRNGYSIKDFVSLYGFEYCPERSSPTADTAKERYQAALKQYVVHDNVVFIPTDSRIYSLLNRYTYNEGISMDSYILSLGFVRTRERPEAAIDKLEKDMEVREIDGSFEDKVFAMYPLLGSRILKQETIEKLNSNTKKYINLILSKPGTKLPLRAEMQITLALINAAKEWKNEENGNFWNYITLQFGYRDTSGSVVRLLQTSLESAMKHNRRLFWEDVNGREFKATVVTHSLSTRKSWMVLFDFLFDFYKNNLNWRVIPNDPLIVVMIRALGQKLSGDDQEETELTISSKVYSFQEGIRKLVLYRPVFTRNLFAKLIEKIHSLVNSEAKPVKTYEEKLCEEWFKGKIASIASTKDSERQTQNGQHEIALDYSRIRVKYILKNETDVHLSLPDIRLKKEDINRAVLSVDCEGNNLLLKNLSWYGNELGKSLIGSSVSLPSIPQAGDSLKLHIQIMCNEDVIYDSEESMNRTELFFRGSTEIPSSQIKRGNYTLIVPTIAELETENVDIVEVSDIKNEGLKAYFLELKDGYIISIDGQLIAFDSENSTEVKVITPSESNILPLVTLHDSEASLAYRRSVCNILLSDIDCLQKFVLLRNGEKIEFTSLEKNDNGLAFTLPLEHGEDKTHIQIINLEDERLVFDRTFVLITEQDCHFNREFYYTAQDYQEAEYHVNIDDFSEIVPFTEGDSEIRIPFREGELHLEIPRIILEETTGTWLQGSQQAWYAGAVSQDSFIKVTKPPKIDIKFFVGGKDILYDGQGIVTIGNVLKSFSGLDNYIDAEVEMQVIGPKANASYSLARVFFKERFLNSPSFWSEGRKLYWDQGGAFIGKANREFSLALTGSDEKVYPFRLNSHTEYVPIPDDMPIGNYRYEISIQSGNLFKRVNEVIAAGDCIIGDRNLLRFMDRRIVVDSITDEFKEEAGQIAIRTCYIDRITFCGIEDTSEGRCPVYSGVMFEKGYHGERYEFSFDNHLNKKGITKMMVNPVRIVYISDRLLCITDPDGDGLYYYSYFDREFGKEVYALTDREYTKANKHKYSNADLYSYRTEGV